MDKKGQITVFIIIGIIFLAVVLLIFLIVPGYVKLPFLVSSEEDSVKNFVSSCIMPTAVQGIKLAGLQGGYINVPENSLAADYSTVAYYYNNGEVTVPTKEKIETEISYFIDNTINLCLKNLSVFEEQGYLVSMGNIIAYTLIRENDVVIKLDLPITIEKAGKLTRVNDYSETVPIRLGHVHDIATLITQKTFEEPEFVDMTFISSFDVKVDILPQEKGKFVYSIIDSKSAIENESYIFLFAVSVVINQPPVLNIPDTIELAEGEPKAIQLTATDPEGDLLSFSDDSALFDITPQGAVLVYPEIPGEYDITITVDDRHGNVISKLVKFVVKEVQK